MPYFPDPRPSFRSVGQHQSGEFNPQEALPRYYKDYAPLPQAPFRFVEYVWPGLTTVQIEQVRGYLTQNPEIVEGWQDLELPQVTAVRFFKDFIVRVCAPGTGGHTFMAYAEILDR